MTSDGPVLRSHGFRQAWVKSFPQDPGRSENALCVSFCAGTRRESRDRGRRARGSSPKDTPRSSREAWEPGAAEFNFGPDQQHGIVGLAGSQASMTPRQKPTAAHSPHFTPRSPRRRTADVLGPHQPHPDRDPRSRSKSDPPSYSLCHAFP